MQQDSYKYNGFLLPALSLSFFDLAVIKMSTMMADTLAITVVDVKEPAKQQQQDEPYSVFSTRTKILIVMTVSISGFFSPFSTNIYFPALSMIEKASIIAISIYIVPMGLVTYSHTSAVLGS